MMCLLTYKVSFMTARLTTSRLARYAVFGFPLGFVGLPLYVHLPKYYADTLPSSLAVIGAVMFFARLIDCLADPWIGYMADRWSRYQSYCIYAAYITLGAGVCGLFYLPHWPQPWILALLLAITYFSYSVLMICFYAAGVSLAEDTHQTVQVSAWRESSILLGVLVASALPQVLMMFMPEVRSYEVFALLFLVVLAGTSLFTLRSGWVSVSHGAQAAVSPFRALLSNGSLRWLFALFFLNAIPPSITATLFLFFVSDILKQPALSGAFLIIYFISAAASMPLWTMLCRQISKRKSLCIAMGTAIISFVWVYRLGAQDSLSFMLICMLSGIALGGDLTILPSLLADVVSQHRRLGGVEFGIWNFISKFTLALAAGISLPFLYYLGYVPGASTAGGLSALSFGYALLPCLFKCVALCLLLLSPIDQPRR
jgi:GPH family glycoside/pentoside/hexuronide:cation symporter